MADFYFGADTSDYAQQYATFGIGSGNEASVMNTVAGFTFVTPTGGIFITELARGMDSSPGQAGVTFPIGVYDITNGTNNATLVVQATGNSRSDNAGYVWHTVTGLNTFVAANRTLAVASGPPSATVWHTRQVDGTSYLNDGTPEITLPATWTQTGTGRVIPLRAGYSLAVSPPTLNNLNTNNVVRVGTTGNTVNTAGLGALTSLTLGGKAATNLNAPSGDGTFDMPSFADGVTYSLMGSVSAVVGDGTATDDLTVTLLPMDGWHYTTLAGTLNTANTGVVFNFSPASAVGDQIVFPLSHNVDAQGNLSTSYEGTVTFYHIQASTGTVRTFLVTTGDGSGTAGNATSSGNVSTYSIGTGTGQGRASTTSTGNQSLFSIGVGVVKGAATAISTGIASLFSIGTGFASGNGQSPAPNTEVTISKKPNTPTFRSVFKSISRKLYNKRDK